nr:glycine cleavage system protein H [candidate division Zixibacteria bacterium]NIS49434.1 glycine cleavage system protein H [candidate division Zixibacteria bacterium]NIU17521.1 glycine cleavage system protein H [candidate division Zixibacteria bacterium]NIV09665.1 glycine cleavage system protein H [candidate division Zixibacteria bacterium]NIW42988.1 glycine cleavage system protein H [candidate division Zixibacteria bacterium]
INEDPYGEAWMLKIQLTSPYELEELLDADQYENLERDH